MSRISKDLAACQARFAHQMASISKPSADNPASPIPHVAVVGAGFAGLRAADALLQAGARVTVFEARNRVGGRVHQERNGAHLVDLGPNWIHGVAGNPMTKLAKQSDSVYVEIEAPAQIVNSDGQPKSGSESVELGNDLWRMVDEASKYSNDHYTDIDPQTSLMDYLRQELPKRFPCDPQKVEELLREAGMWGFWVGTAVERQSLRCFFLEENLGDDNAFVSSTYQKIAQAVSQRAVECGVVKLDSEIVAIQYREPQDRMAPVTLTTKHGSMHSFDEVIVACPLGWLKKNKAAFTPSLPVRLSQAIDNISYGHLEKLIITFPAAFWTNRGVGNLSCADSDTKPLLIHFHHPEYHPNPLSKTSQHWNVSIVSLANFGPEQAHPSLLMYLYGATGEHLTRAVKGLEPHSGAYDQILADFAHPYFSRIPGFDASSPDCIPTSYLMTQWRNDPYAGNGSYSNFQIGLEYGDQDIECMRDAGGLSDAGQGLWLAGEHVAPFVAVGTVAGAYWSGEAVAVRLAAKYQLELHINDQIENVAA